MDFNNGQEFKTHNARIAVVGAGGGGNNTVSTLYNKKIAGAVTVSINTDANHLNLVYADKKILIGKKNTKGLGAGGYPEIGKKAAFESKEEIKNSLKGADLVFVTCGLGGGTGTGASPVVAQIAKEMGSIVIGVVTLPFKIEGSRIAKAEEGLQYLREICDTVIVVENQKLLEYAGNLPLKQAFHVGDDLIATMIKGLTETIHVPSLVNLDFADVRSIMSSGGVAAIGVGESESDEDRAQEAVTKALNNRLLEVDYSGAKGALIQVIGGEDMTLEEINTIGEVIQTELDPTAQVIWGAKVDTSFKNKIQVITILTGVKSPYILGPTKQRKDADYGVEVIDIDSDTKHTPKGIGGE